MNVPKNSERVRVAVNWYEQCTIGDCLDVGSLASSLYTEEGLLGGLLKALNAHDCITAKQLHGYMLCFLHARSRDCLEQSRLGRDKLPELYVNLRTTAYYATFFGRKSQPRLKPNLFVIVQLPPEEVERARRKSLSALGIDPQELENLVLRFGRVYVKLCRKEISRDAVDSLVLLGADCGLDIERAGASVEEFRGWLRQVNRSSLKRSLNYLNAHDLPTLLKQREVTGEALTCVTNILDLEGASQMVEEDMDWHSQVLLSPSEVGLEAADIERLQRISHNYSPD